MSTKHEERTVPTPIRFDAATKRRVRAVAKRLGSNSSAIVRLATIRLLKEIDRTGELRLSNLSDTAA